NPNPKAAAARRPDLVVLYRSPLNETAAAQLGRLGIPAAVLRQDRLEDVARAARLLGRLTGRAAAGDSLADSLTRLLETGVPAARTGLAFVVWDNPPMVIGGGSYLDQLATLAGAANVFRHLGDAGATAGLEPRAVRRRPDTAAATGAAGVPRGRLARALGSGAPSARPQSPRRSLPPRAVGRGRARCGRGDRAPSREPVGAAARGVRRRAGRDGAR